MNKLFKKIGGAILGLALSIGVGVAIGSVASSGGLETRATDTWVKATSIAAGDTVVFVCEDAGKELTSISSTATKYGIGTSYSGNPACTYQFSVVTGYNSSGLAFQNGSNYLYWTSGNSLNTNSTLSENTSWDVSIDSSGIATILNKGNTDRQIWWNVGSPRFACYTGKTADSSYYSIQLYKKISTTPSVEITSGDSTKTFTVLKGNSNNDVTVLVKNIDSPTLSFSYDENGVEGNSSSEYISVVESEPNNGVYTLTITGTKVHTSGNTVIHISASGTACTDTITVTVNPKPASMTIVHKDIVEGNLEIRTGASKQVSFSGEDTDGNNYSIVADDVTGTIVSGSSYVSLSGVRITGVAPGTAVVKYTLNVLASVYAEVTVNVADDYNASVTSISYVENAAGEQGEYLVLSDIISGSVTKTHFNLTGEIAENEYLLSYNNNRASAVSIGEFVYEITDTSLGAGDTEERDIYVFVTFNESYSSSTSVSITVADRPVTGLLVDGVAKANNDDVDLELERNSTYNLNEHVSVNPANATESKEINYSLEVGEDYVSLNNGVLTIGHLSGETVACVSASPKALPSFSINLWITITRESVQFKANLPASLTKLTSISIGDSVAFVYESASKELSSITTSGTTIGVASTYESNPTGSFLLTIEAGNGGSGYSFKTLSNTYLSYSSGNSLTTSSQKNDASSWTISENTNGSFKFANVGTTGRILQYNSGSPRWACYTSNQAPFQIYKYTGGEKSITASSSLLDILDSNMTYNGGFYDLKMCDDDGIVFSASTWNLFGNSFTSTIISDNKLAYAVANAKGNEVQRFLACYDYVIGTKKALGGNWATANDFLGRFTNDGIHAGAKFASFTPSNSESNSIIVIAIVVSLTSIAVIGGYVVLRKRKHN